LKQWGDSLRKAAALLGSLDDFSIGGTTDYQALHWGIEQLVKRNESRKVLFIITDAVGCARHEMKQINKIAESFGWPMGPAYLQDVVGIDTSHHVGDVLAEGYPDRMNKSFKTALDVMYENKRFGQKNGIGFYKYETDPKGMKFDTLEIPEGQREEARQWRTKLIEALADFDVASYYPSIILRCGLEPENMAQHFTPVYRQIVQRRLAAKKAGDRVQDAVLKIVINGSFGKFGSPYSALYSPRLLIQTTVTGQLALLMLIEMLEAEGIPVVSANTDGIVIRCPRSLVDMMEFVVGQWEDATGFTTEETAYSALYSRDVNNYLAIKADGSVKRKGVFATGTLSKNPVNEICMGAVVKHLVDGTPVEESIRACTDIRKFVTIRTVKGGAVQDDQYLGRAVRWYYALGELGTINYRVNGYTVARSEGAKPLMELPDIFPTDVDYQWYIDEAHNLLSDIGAVR
jgi:hypothetical protein